jgi:hypothetical protein
MSNQVKVEALEVFNRFRIALLKFAEAADQSITNADSQIARMHNWLENEQTRFWETQIRKRTEDVANAKNAVRQKKLYLDGAGRQRGAPEEEKALARAVAMLEQAHEKRDAVRKWIPRLEKAADLYRGGVSRLVSDIAVEVPRAVGLLDRLAESLQAYVNIESPTMATMGEAGIGEASAGFARPPAEQEVAPGAPQPPPAAEIAAEPPIAGPSAGIPATTPQEDRDVHHG